MGDPFSTGAAILGGSQVLGGLLGGDSTTTTETQYKSQPFTVTLPSGAKITLYKNTPVGETSSQDIGVGDVLGNAITAGGQAYGLSSALGASKTPSAVSDVGFPNYVEDWYK